MTHTELCHKAEKWLMKKGCAFAFRELRAVTGHSEEPDAIGFKTGFSIMIECKISRSDFLSDKKKIFRRIPKCGMGQYRFYMAPEGIIKPEDLLEKWGLITVNEKGVARQKVGPKGNCWSHQKEFRFDEYHKDGKTAMMASALRRLHLRGVMPMIYEGPIGGFIKK